jgi:hypothetical protein
MSVKKKGTAAKKSRPKVDPPKARPVDNPPQLSRTGLEELRRLLVSKFHRP